MTVDPATELLERLSAIVSDAVREIRQLDAGEPYLAEAIIKCSIRDFAWSLWESFPNNRLEIADQLQMMVDPLREKQDGG